MPKVTALKPWLMIKCWESSTDVDYWALEAYHCTEYWMMVNKWVCFTGEDEAHEAYYSTKTLKGGKLQAVMGQDWQRSICSDLQYWNIDVDKLLSIWYQVGKEAFGACPMSRHWALHGNKLQSVFPESGWIGTWIMAQHWNADFDKLLDVFFQPGW